MERVPTDRRMVDSCALVCMVIAMKYEERSDNLPTIDQMLSSNPQCEMRVDDLPTLENDILDAYAFFDAFTLGSTGNWSALP